MIIMRSARLALLAACAAAALGTCLARSLETAGVANATAGRAVDAATARTWSLSLSPAPGDLTLVAIGFRGGSGKPLGARSLSVAAKGVFGDDYLATAVPRLTSPRALRALVLLVNRPSALLDPAHVLLALRSSRSLGSPVVRKLADPFAKPHTGAKPAICALPLHGRPLRASGLRLLGSHGAPLAGFGATSAVAQAYDVACGLPYSGAFKEALAGSSTAPAPVPTPLPPRPPGPQPPGCTPCNPPPGSACPLDSGPNVCVASFAGGAQRLRAAGH
jgi:hypothetical protein